MADTDVTTLPVPPADPQATAQVPGPPQGSVAVAQQTAAVPPMPASPQGGGQVQTPPPPAPPLPDQALPSHAESGQAQPAQAHPVQARVTHEPAQPKEGENLQAPEIPEGGFALPDGWLPCPKGANEKEWVLDPTVPEPKIRIRHLTKAFGSRVIWEDLTFDIPKGKVTVILGPSGTGKSVLLRHLIGLLRPTEGQLWVDDKNVPELKNRPLLEVRKKYGVLFQDGALFGSMTIRDNVAFPLREHTRKNEKEIMEIVEHNLEIVGLSDAIDLFPGEISGGMKKRAGLARGLVLDPEILLFDEPDSGLDPVRTAFLNELILDLKEQLDSTFVIVTHHIPTAKNISDHLALLYRKSLTLAGPKERLLNSEQPAVRQFLRGSTSGPIGMSEEKDSGDDSADYDPDAGGLEDTRDDEALPGSA